MTPIVTKLLHIAESVTKKPNTSEPVQAIVRQDGSLFAHDILSVEEEFINRKIRGKIRCHWLFHSIIFEFEPNNKVFVSIITKLGNVIDMEFELEDLWFDDNTSTISIRLDVANVDMGGMVLNTIVHIFGNWGLALVGNIFNPFQIGDDGSIVRFEKKGLVRFDFSPHSGIRDFLPLPERDESSTGPILLTNAKTIQSALQIEYYAFHDPIEEYTTPDIPMKTSWVRSIDMAAALLLPIGVWITFIILNHYLPHEELAEYTFSTYFFISLAIFIFSFMVMNIPRYIYMYFETRKKWQSVFVSNNIKIQMRKLHRRIIMQKAALEESHDLDVKARQERIVDLLMQIRDKRFLTQHLTIADEDRDRKQKVKFIVAYVICTLLEWILLMH